ncbi:hypothetical protein KY366_03755 [Candidatus Woesearchaeota archaeon]|nr:hypothetical protein [Candidatus Woesearchaeota archaeon]
MKEKNDSGNGHALISYNKVQVYWQMVQSLFELAGYDVIIGGNTPTRVIDFIKGGLNGKDNYSGPNPHFDVCMLQLNRDGLNGGLRSDLKVYEIFQDLNPDALFFALSYDDKLLESALKEGLPNCLNQNDLAGIVVAPDMDSKEFSSITEKMKNYMDNGIPGLQPQASEKLIQMVDKYHQKRDELKKSGESYRL